MKKQIFIQAAIFIAFFCLPLMGFAQTTKTTTTKSDANLSSTSSTSKTKTYVAVYADNSYAVLSEDDLNAMTAPQQHSNEYPVLVLEASTAKTATVERSSLSGQYEDLSAMARPRGGKKEKETASGGKGGSDSWPIMCRCSDGRYVQGTMTDGGVSNCQTICTNGGIKPETLTNIEAELQQKGIELSK